MALSRGQQLQLDALMDDDDALFDASVYIRQKLEQIERNAAPGTSDRELALAASRGARAARREAMRERRVSAVIVPARLAPSVSVGLVFKEAEPVDVKDLLADEEVTNIETPEDLLRLCASTKGTIVHLLPLADAMMLDAAGGGGPDGSEGPLGLADAKVVVLDPVALAKDKRFSADIIKARNEVEGAGAGAGAGAVPLRPGASSSNGRMTRSSETDRALAADLDASKSPSLLRSENIARRASSLIGSDRAGSSRAAPSLARRLVMDSVDSAGGSGAAVGASFSYPASAATSSSFSALGGVPTLPVRVIHTGAAGYDAATTEEWRKRYNKGQARDQQLTVGGSLSKRGGNTGTGGVADSSAAHVAPLWTPGVQGYHPHIPQGTMVQEGKRWKALVNDEGYLINGPPPWHKDAIARPWTQAPAPAEFDGGGEGPYAKAESRLRLIPSLKAINELGYVNGWSIQKAWTASLLAGVPMQYVAGGRGPRASSGVASSSSSSAPAFKRPRSMHQQEEEDNEDGVGVGAGSGDKKGEYSRDAFEYEEAKRGTFSRDAGGKPAISIPAQARPSTAPCFPPWVNPASVYAKDYAGYFASGVYWKVQEESVAKSGLFSVSAPSRASGSSNCGTRPVLGAGVGLESPPTPSKIARMYEDEDEVRSMAWLGGRAGAGVEGKFALMYDLEASMPREGKKKRDIRVTLRLAIPDEKGDSTSRVTAKPAKRAQTLASSATGVTHSSFSAGDSKHVIANTANAGISASAALRAGTKRAREEAEQEFIRISASRSSRASRGTGSTPLLTTRGSVPVSAHTTAVEKRSLRGSKLVASKKVDDEEEEEVSGPHEVAVLDNRGASTRPARAAPPPSRYSALAEPVPAATPARAKKPSWGYVDRLSGEEIKEEDIVQAKVKGKGDASEPELRPTRAGSKRGRDETPAPVLRASTRITAGKHAGRTETEDEDEEEGPVAAPNPVKSKGRDKMPKPAPAPAQAAPASRASLPSAGMSVGPCTPGPSPAPSARAMTQGSAGPRLPHVQAHAGAMSPFYPMPMAGKLPEVAAQYLRVAAEHQAAIKRGGSSPSSASCATGPGSLHKLVPPRTEPVTYIPTGTGRADTGKQGGLLSLLSSGLQNMFS